MRTQTLITNDPDELLRLRADEASERYRSAMQDIATRLGAGELTPEEARTAASNLSQARKEEIAQIYDGAEGEVR